MDGICGHILLARQTDGQSDEGWMGRQTANVRWMDEPIDKMTN